MFHFRLDGYQLFSFSLRQDSPSLDPSPGLCLRVSRYRKIYIGNENYDCAEGWS